MAITVGVKGVHLWQGLAADTKPGANDGRVALNDVFFETDTTKYYLWNGSVWTYTGAIAAAPPL